MAPSYKPQQFAQRLEELFELRGLKADYVAHKVGISKAYLSRLRHGKATNPGFTIIQALAAVFDVSPAYFFGEEDSPKLEDIAMRASDLDDKGRKALTDILTYLANLQESDETQEQTDDPPQ
jgi:transcriptional regulator with XRE-family HTH domain